QPRMANSHSRRPSLRSSECVSFAHSPSCERPVAAEHFNGRSREIDVIVPFRPLQAQIPTGKVGCNAPFGSARQHSRDRNGPGSGTASKSFPRAPFPDANCHFFGPVGAHELHIGTTWKDFMAFHFRANAVDQGVAQGIDVGYAVRVSHGET